MKPRKIRMDEVKRIENELPEGVHLRINDGFLYPIFSLPNTPMDILLSRYKTALTALQKLGISALHLQIEHSNALQTIVASYPVDYQLDFWNI